MGLAFGIENTSAFTKVMLRVKLRPRLSASHVNKALAKQKVLRLHQIDDDLHNTWYQPALTPLFAILFPEDSFVRVGGWEEGQGSGGGNQGRDIVVLVWYDFCPFGTGSSHLR